MRPRCSPGVTAIARYIQRSRTQALSDREREDTPLRQVSQRYAADIRVSRSVAFFMRPRLRCCIVPVWGVDSTQFDPTWGRGFQQPSLHLPNKHLAFNLDNRIFTYHTHPLSRRGQSPVKPVSSVSHLQTWVSWSNPRYCGPAAGSKSAGHGFARLYDAGQPGSACPRLLRIGVSHHQRLPRRLLRDRPTHQEPMRKAARERERSCENLLRRLCRGMTGPGKRYQLSTTNP